jgi:hypothetical protein
MKIIQIALLLFLVSTLGCQKDRGPRAFVALKTVSVYKTHKGDSLQEVFKLSPGDQCAAGRVEIEKTFGYLEVVCPGKGYGWVIKGVDYKLVDKATAKEIIK